MRTSIFGWASSNAISLSMPEVNTSSISNLTFTPTICGDEHLANKKRSGAIFFKNEILGVNTVFSYLHKAQSGAKRINAVG